MTIEILMPALSPTMEEGTLAKWLVKEGDVVQSGDLLAEIETDKATMEFEAVDEGTIGKLIVPEGTEGVAVNTPIALLLEEGETEIAAITPAIITKEPDEKPVAAPPVIEPVAKKASERSVVVSEPKSSTATPGSRLFATPLARRIAADKGLDLAQIQGSGPKGRIVKSDVETATPVAKSVSQTVAPAPISAPTPTSASSAQVAALYTDREYVEVPLDGMRRIIAARLTEAKQTIPHFYIRRDIHLDNLLKLRREMNKGLEARGVKLSLNDYIIKACAMALQDVPECNSVWAGDRILRLKPSDVAVAVAIEGGLFTPVLRDSHIKTLSALSTEMKDLAARARTRKLAPHEYQGGSFAISNLGMFGIQNFDAVINPPHGSILAVGAGEKKPVVGPDGDLTIATVMSVTLSVDHRVIDGALGAQFLAAVKSYLEEPLSMLA